jgi:hypothetical protein
MAAERSERSPPPLPWCSASTLCVSRLLRFYPLDLYPSENKPLVFLFGFMRLHESSSGGNGAGEWRSYGCCGGIAPWSLCVSRSMQRHGTILSKEIRGDPRRSCDGKS